MRLRSRAEGTDVEDRIGQVLHQEPGEQTCRRAAVLRLPVRPLSDANLRALRTVVVRRCQVTALRAQEKTRLERAPSDLQPRIRAHLEWLQAEPRP